jgi:outer membrane lipoprotein-sorting protein
MMHRSLLAFLAVVVLLPLQAVAAEALPDALFAHPRSPNELVTTVLSDTAKKLKAAQTLRGRFVLRKHLREIPAPLTATGEFVFARDLGVYWHTQVPFDSVFLLTPSGARQRDEGSETFRMDAKQQPGVRAALEIFVALFRLDVESLANNFQLYGVSDQQGWRIGLRPRAAAMSSVFTQAIVAGRTQIERIELSDGNGDRTEIVVQDVQTNSAAPDAQIRALFAD